MEVSLTRPDSSESIGDTYKKVTAFPRKYRRYIVGLADNYWDDSEAVGKASARARTVSATCPEVSVTILGNVNATFGAVVRIFQTTGKTYKVRVIPPELSPILLDESATPSEVSVTLPQWSATRRNVSVNVPSMTRFEVSVIYIPDNLRHIDGTNRAVVDSFLSRGNISGRFGGISSNAAIDPKLSATILEVSPTLPEALADYPKKLILWMLSNEKLLLTSSMLSHLLSIWYFLLVFDDVFLCQVAKTISRGDLRKDPHLITIRVRTYLLLAQDNTLWCGDTFVLENMHAKLWAT